MQFRLYFRLKIVFVIYTDVSYRIKSTNFLILIRTFKISFDTNRKRKVPAMTFRNSSVKEYTTQYNAVISATKSE
jgi:hypothetical protein